MEVINLCKETAEALNLAEVCSELSASDLNYLLTNTTVCEVEEIIPGVEIYRYYGKNEEICGLSYDQDAGAMDLLHFCKE